LRTGDWPKYEALFQKLIAQEEMLLQPFLNNIVEKGELALMLVDGEVTHAVLKTAKAGDFRVQDNYGGSVRPYKPSEEAVALAKAAVAACPIAPLYARADLVWDNAGKLAVSELEIFEPEMWFRFKPAAAEQLAVALSAYLHDKL
jgi:glutathione synthase/RimK-type ligase-like ATP-grasp enzyme